MAETPITITLSEQASKRLRERMAWADHPTAEFVVEDALHVMFESQEPPIDQNELDEIQQACEEFDRNPASALTEAQLDASLAEVFRQERERQPLLRAG